VLIAATGYWQRPVSFSAILQPNGQLWAKFGVLVCIIPTGAHKEASVGGFLFVLRTGPKKATSDGILHDTPTEATAVGEIRWTHTDTPKPGPRRLFPADYKLV
jgi:hypothetical protein